jgi:acetyl esterase/lipase
MKKLFYLPLMATVIAMMISQSCRKPQKELEETKSMLSLTSTCEDPIRYRDIVFDANFIRVQNDIVYRRPSQYNALDWRKDTLKLDYYEPNRDLDTAVLRPLIIYMHGGGGEIGSKSNEVANCMNFARRGYVVVAINYRLDTLEEFDPNNPDFTRREAATAYYRQIQDARFAIRFAKHLAADVRVDTNKIIFGGLSNGGVQTLHAAYLDDAEAALLDQADLISVDTLGVLDYKNDSVPFNTTSKIAAGLCFSGWILDIGFIDAGDPPMILVHAESDNYSPIDQGYDWIWGIFYIWGPRAIKTRLQQLSIPVYYYEYADGPPSCQYEEPTCPGNHGAVVNFNGGGVTLEAPGVNAAFEQLSDFFFGGCPEEQSK